MEVIKSVNNPTIKDLVKLKQKKVRDEKRLFLAEGEHLVEEAKDAGILQKLIVREEAKEKYSGENVLYVSDEVMKKLSETVSLLDVIGVCSYMEERPYQSAKILILDGVQDPGNVGTLIRTALSFGFNDIICSNDSVDIYNEKVLRSTQGAVFKVNYHRGNLLPIIHDLKALGYTVYGTSLMNGKPLTTFEKVDKLLLIDL